MPGQHAEISSAELVEWQAKGAQVVDVREEIELLNGVIPGAVSVPISRFVEQVAELDERPVVFVCVSGSRSRNAAAYLVQQGFEHEVANLTHGMNEWRAEGRAVDRFVPPQQDEAEG